MTARDKITFESMRNTLRAIRYDCVSIGEGRMEIDYEDFLECLIRTINEEIGPETEPERSPELTRQQLDDQVSADIAAMYAEEVAEEPAAEDYTP